MAQCPCAGDFKFGYQRYLDTLLPMGGSSDHRWPTDRRMIVKQFLATLLVGAALVALTNSANAQSLTKSFTGVCQGMRSSSATIVGRASMTLDALHGDTNGHRNLDANTSCIIKDWDLTLFCPEPKNVCRAIGVMHLVPKFYHYEMTKTLDVIDLGKGE
jgi:hypothetical protein